MNVLFIGGTGQISLPCVERAVAQGHQIAVLNRGTTSVPLPDGVETIVGDMSAANPYVNLGQRTFDVVCQFRAFTPDQVENDIATFNGKAGQYIFISSASVYQKPATNFVITEEKTPAINPYWKYSQAKIACEEVITNSSGLNWTIVRPSHTVRTGLPGQIGSGDGFARRLLAGKPVLVTGDGTSLWTLTRAADFAVPFVNLFGKAHAMRDTFHITQHMFGYTWDQITRAIARGLGVEAEIVHVPTDTLVKYNPDWIGPLTGDKIWSALFDNSKVMKVAGDFTCEKDLDKVLAEPIANYKSRAAAPAQPDPEDALMDRIIADQRALGA